MKIREILYENVINDRISDHFRVIELLLVCVKDKKYGKFFQPLRVMM